MQKEDILKEIIKCKKSFPFFAKNYLRVFNPERGIVPFELYGFQEKRVFPAFEEERFVILKKFRQGGLSTLAAMYALWKCLFFNDQSFLVISKSDREAKNIITMIKTSWDYLPDWIKCETVELNQHVMKLENGSVIRAGTPKMGRSYSANTIIIDEAAFIQRMDEVWRSIFPTLSAAGKKGKAFVISTVNGVGNWYADTYFDAKQGLNNFKVIDLQYKEHPQYNNEEYVRTMRKQLGEKGWAQEVLGEFFSSSDTFIKPETLAAMKAQIDNQQNPHTPHSNRNLWVWERPIKNRSYIISIDVAEGLGGDHDYQAMQVIDQTSLDQVAEFYDNNINTHEFAKIIHEVGKYYNNALVVVENNGYGHAVLENLHYDLQYDNIYWHRTSRKVAMGIKNTPKIRKLLMNALENAIENKHVKIRSPRLLHELESFVYNTTKKRPEARQGRHDDLILSLSLGLFVRILLNRGTMFPAIDEEEIDFEPNFNKEYDKEVKELGFEDKKLNRPYMITEEEKEESINHDLTYLKVLRDEDDDDLLEEFGWKGIEVYD